MTSALRLNHFIASANQAYAAPRPQYLSANRQGLGVRVLDLPKTFSPEAKEQHKETWRTFRDDLVDTIGPTKFGWICHRYRANLNFAHMEATGQPLRPEHIELFSVGASQLLGRDIKTHFPGNIKTLSRQQLADRMRHVQPFPIVGSYKDPMRIHGAPPTLLANFFHNKLMMDKEKQLLFSDLERLSFRAWLERMSKVIVNRELIEGQLIPAPGHDGRTDFYKVYKKIGTGDGLVAYALKPATCDSSLKPLLVFRPSQWALSNEDAIETYLNDVQGHVGEMGWKAAERHFEQLMVDPRFRRNNEKISLAGYSLGGAHAQYFLAAHADHVSNAVFYADPGVDKLTAERFAQRMNQMPRRAEPLTIQIIRVKRDFCHYVGDKHLGWGVNHPDVIIQLIEIAHDHSTAAAFTLHAHRLYDNSEFPYRMQCYENPQELFNHLDNTKRGPDVFWYEKMRRLWGGVAFYTLYILSEFIKLISGIFGIKILRSSRNPDF